MAMTETDCAQQSEEPTNPTAPFSSENADSFSNDPFFHRTDWLSFWITTVVVWLVYLFTMAPDVTLENSGLFSTGAAYAGVPDCPGLPVWTIYSWLFIKLIPFSNIAWRVTIGSTVAAALACGMVALMVSRGGKMLLENTPTFVSRKPADQNLLRVTCGYVAGMALGLSGTIWQEAVVVDYWALSILLFALMLCLLMRWTGVPERRRFLYGAFFVFGLLLTSNQELIAVTPALLLWVMLRDKKLGRDLFLVMGILVVIGWLADNYGRYPWFDSYISRNVPLWIAFLPVAVAAVVAIIITRRIGSEQLTATFCGVFLLLGLASYFYMPIASMTNPPINWAYPRTVEGFFHNITRGQYEQLNPVHEVGRFIVQLWMLTKQTGREFGWFYLVFIALPFCLLHRTGRSARSWMLGLTAVFICVGPVMVAALNPSVDRQTMELMLPYFSAIYVVLSVWTGLGLVVFGSVVAKPPAWSSP
ncbi:MAG: DUF2723 domain-containing protein [Verrucomicrobiia bacterium]